MPQAIHGNRKQDHVPGNILDGTNAHQKQTPLLWLRQDRVVPRASLLNDIFRLAFKQLREFDLRDALGIRLLYSTYKMVTALGSGKSGI